jgi:methionyl-tRNA formyltransferase
LKALTYGILASGQLGAKCAEQIIKNKKVLFLFTDRHSDAVIKIARKNNIPIFEGNPRSQDASGFLSDKPVDVILSVNYLFIVNEDVIQAASKFAINFHGSLLPKYRGRTPHVWAIINNESETGITAHLISRECDEGDIIHQETIPISTTMSGADLLANYEEKYPSVIEKVITMVETNNFQLVKQDNSKATFFGKRTPDSGEVDWNWQRERIYNWVRAQAKPYPGAFTFYKNKKVHIHKVIFDDSGFHYLDENGKILSTNDGIVVKTPNGAIKILELETEGELIITAQDLFHARH